MAITFFFVVLQATPPSGFNHLTYGLVVGSAMGLIFAIAFVLVHKKLLAMTGEFRFSLTPLQSVLSKFRMSRTNNVEPTVEEFNQGAEFESTPDNISREDDPELSASKAILEQTDSDSPEIDKASYENMYTTKIIQDETGVVSLNTNSTSEGTGYGAIEIQASEDDNSDSKLFNNVEKPLVSESGEVKRVFQPLQLLCACYAAINHGSNDVANCIGPLVTAWMIYKVLIHP